MPILTGDGDRFPQRLIAIGVAGVVLVVAVIGGVLALGGDDSPDTLAAVSTEVEPVVTELTDDFCSDPQPITDAPDPSTSDPNRFAGFTKLGALSFESSPTDVYDAAWYSDGGLATGGATAAKADPTYALCLTAVGNGRDRVCQAYDNGVVYTIYGMDWSYSLYQLSTGEETQSGTIPSLESRCPLVIIGDSEIQAFDTRQARIRTIDFATPGTFTYHHLLRDLRNGSPSWCNEPTAVTSLLEVQAAAAPATTTTVADPDAGATDANNSEELPVDPGVVLLVGDSSPSRSLDVMETRTGILTDITHVACVSYQVSPTGEKFTCRYMPLGHDLHYVEGTYTATLVDIATGEVIAAEPFEGDTTCPDHYDFDGALQLESRPNVPAGVAEWIDATVRNPPSEE